MGDEEELFGFHCLSTLMTKRLYLVKFTLQKPCNKDVESIVCSQISALVSQGENE